MARVSELYAFGQYRPVLNMTQGRVLIIKRRSLTRPPEYFSETAVPDEMRYVDYNVPSGSGLIEELKPTDPRQIDEPTELTPEEIDQGRRAVDGRGSISKEIIPSDSQ